MRRFVAAMLVSLSLAPLAQAKAASETATLSGGCFWGMEEYFRKVPGVLETRVGYTGGTLKDPSYEAVASGQSGHAESLELSFDPKVVSYESLLVMFFKMHDPTTADRQGNDRGSQYRSAIFYHSDAQRQVAEAVKAKAAKAWGKPITTQVNPEKPFYAAEDYHQKYLVKNPGGYDNHYVRDLKLD